MATTAAHADQPHVVFFPLPAQGHLTPALQLAKLLHHCLGFQITFIHTEHNRRRLLRSRGPGALAGVPGFRFAVVPDGLQLPSSEPDALEEMVAMLFSLETFVPHFRDLVSELPPVTHVVSDIEQILRSSKEMGLRSVALCTISACGFMAFQQCQQLVDRGIIPLKDTEQLWNGYLDSTLVDWVPGMPKDMRLRDFPSFIRTMEHDDVFLSMMLRLMECHRTIPSAVIFHTFDELESQVMAAMSAILPPSYVVGPLPLLLKQVTAAGSASDRLGSNLLKENHSCMEWLAGKRPNSVVYVSFGSIAALASEQLLEFAWGLANSGHEFLWVLRVEEVKGGHAAAALPLPPEFWEETRARSHVASWCPQEEVLQHEVKTAIGETMKGDKGKEMKRMATKWKEKATAAALPGGPSWVNLEKLVNEVFFV